MPDDLLESLERAAALRESPKPEAQADPVDAALNQINRESGDLRPIPLPWPRLSRLSRLLRPGGLSVVGGAPGSGKSFFALSIGLACRDAGASWAYLPLESDRAFYLRRVAAMLDRSFDALLTPEDRHDAKAVASAAVERVRPELKALAPSIFENPALPTATGEARQIGPDFILEWLGAQFDHGRRVCIFDPLAMVAFDGRDLWRAESEFVQALVNLAYRSDATILMVSHTVKKIESRTLDVGDLQGGAAIGRLASAVVLLQAHESKSVNVFREGGMTGSVQSNRTISVGKSRNSESGAPVAFDFGHAGPTFREQGVICPKGRAAVQTDDDRLPYSD